MLVNSATNTKYYIMTCLVWLAQGGTVVSIVLGPLHEHFFIVSFGGWNTTLQFYDLIRGLLICPSPETLKCEDLSGPKSGPLWGSSHGDLGYESKCWAEFNSQFDKLTSRIGADK